MSTATATTSTAPVLSARVLVLAGGAAAFDLDLQPGKVLGISGLEGHGQDRLLEVLCGLRQPVGGTLAMDGFGLPSGRLRSLQDAFDHRIAYVPRDRKTEGIMPALSVLENFAIGTLRQNARAGVLDRRAIRRQYEAFAERLGIVCAGQGTPIGTLSGGNQQKVLLARWLAADPRVLLLNDPSRGVDHPTRISLYRLYREVAAEGASVVLLSTEIEELLLVADEIVVFRDQTVSARLEGAQRTRDRVLAAMFGGHHG
jgi:ribose transport system ATP-binding protein